MTADASPFDADKQRVLAQVASAFDYLTDDHDAAEKLVPWLRNQLHTILGNVTYGQMEVYELAATVAILGPAFSRTLASKRQKAEPFPPLRAVDKR